MKYYTSLLACFALLLATTAVGAISPATLRTVEAELGCRRSFAANNCEFWVDGAARTKVGYQGWSEAGLHSEVITKTADPPTELIIGQVVGAQNLSTSSQANTTVDIFVRGTFDQTSGRWLLDSLCQRRQPPQGTMSPDLEPQTLAFVMKRTRDDVCLWLTDAGQAPFIVEAVFVPPVYPEFVGRKQFVWANQRVSLFNQKRACVS
ncbi:uncharacterized protein ACA1_289630 [Acanthamoeba castellanii str. Neff]|uniref:Uncharacterized protein n=1 Tax=Acanthamoeba castellanii (strain ATCC 30010 / Neff) TaxID=1257118 RepID=L8HJ50_ACACF|nr:uncharacterized protein ACA1_289630 [Acanthamoeba castellanii str. Neff]ELR25210.1 hypothetical protein ACA1_289630 [Acanthamoeba castellanii str. Neff]